MLSGQSLKPFYKNGRLWAFCMEKSNALGSTYSSVVDMASGAGKSMHLTSKLKSGLAGLLGKGVLDCDIADVLLVSGRFRALFTDYLRTLTPGLADICREAVLDRIEGAASALTTKYINTIVTFPRSVRQ